MKDYEYWVGYRRMTPYERWWFRQLSEGKAFFWLRFIAERYIDWKISRMTPEEIHEAAVKAQREGVVVSTSGSQARSTE